VSSRDGAECERTADELNQRYGNGRKVSRGVPGDLARLADVQRLAEEAVSAFDGLDILVCNAAVMPFMGNSADTPPDVFDKILTVNIHHNFRLAQAVRRSMRERGGGSIVLIGSATGHMPMIQTMAYSIAKSGVAHMVRCLADEMVVDNIRVNGVAPGLIRSAASTPLWSDPQLLEESVRDIPLGRIGEPEDIAGAVIFLSSAAGSFVTGSTILVDGGRVLLTPPVARAS
jgi:NAD(P)-dependent dehydrogenase (short-subunit alcohol dehydrogenase family)